MGGTRSSGSTTAGGPTVTTSTPAPVVSSLPSHLSSRSVVSLNRDNDLVIEQYKVGLHYYGTIVGPDGGEYFIKKTLTQPEADRINKIQGLAGSRGAYRAGDRYNGWESRDALIARARQLV